MKKTIRIRLFSMFLVFIFIFGTFDKAFAKGLKELPQMQKGNYYGKEIDERQKVKQVEQSNAKTKEDLRKPQLENQKDKLEKYKGKEERVDKRTENSKTYKLDEKHNVTEIYFDKIHYKDSNGQLQDIDNTLVSKGKGNGEVYQNKENDFSVSLPKSIEKGEGITIERGSNKIKLFPMEGDFTKSSVSENAILYNDVFKGIDYQYTVNNSFVKEDIILNYNVNKNVFMYQMNTNGLQLKEENNKIVAYEKGKNTPVFVLSAPAMTDASGNTSFNLKLSLKKKLFFNDTITVTADKEWLQSKDRAYPVRIDPNIEIPNPEDPDTANLIAVTTAEEGAPKVNTLDNGYAYIGYDDGIASQNWVDAGKRFLNTRTYVYFPHMIPAEARVTSAALSMYKYTSYESYERNIGIYSMDKDYEFSEITWENQPINTDELSSYGVSTINGSKGWVDWDITQLANDWVNGKPNYGIQLKYTNEDQQCEVFATANNEYESRRPKVSIEYEIVGDVDPDIPLEVQAVNLRPIVEHGNDGFLKVHGLFADGVAKPGSEVTYSLEPDTGLSFNGTVLADDTFKYPDGSAFEGSYDKAYIPMGKDSNWQTEEGQLLQPRLDTLYRIAATASFEGEDSSTSYSDSFQIYESKFKDLLPYIADFYGVSIDTLMKDNKVGDPLMMEGNTIFIRNPQKHAGEPYTQESLTDEKMSEIDNVLMNRGKHCVFNFEPINLNTGNFNYAAKDASVPDINGDFLISRYYNAKVEPHDGYFGVRWDFSFNKSLSLLRDGTIVYARGDGSALYFRKNSDGSYSAPAGENYKLIKNTSTAEDRKDISFELIEGDNITYTFNSMGLLKSEKDIKGNVTNLKYDSNYRLTEIVAPSGKAYGISLNGDGRISNIMLPNGANLKYSYDSKGNLISFIDANNKEITYFYDEKGRMTSFIDPNGNTMIKNTYDDKNRVTVQEDPNGKQIYINYYDGYNETIDANGNKTLYYIDENFRTTKIVRADGNTEETTYDSNNQVKTKKDALGNVTTYEYDSRGNKTKEIRYDNKERIYTYDSNNNVTSITDFNGKITKLDYDSKGNLLKVIKPDNSSLEYTYNDKSQLESSKNADGYVTKYEYTGANLTKITDPKENEFKYYYNSMGKVITIEDPAAKVTRLAYSLNGELLNTLLPDNSLTKYNYDSNGNNISIVDSYDKATLFEYDKLSKITKATDPLGNETTFEYDGNGNKIKEKDASGKTTEYFYDNLNRLEKVIDGDGGETIFTRDPLGNIVTSKDPLGNEATYVYNYAVNKIEQVTNTLKQTITKEYDNEGNLTKVIYPDGNYKTYEYDELYRLKKLRDVDGVFTTTEYDGEGKITSIVDTLGKTYKYEYDENGNLVKTTDSLNYVVTYTYDANNHMKTVTGEDGKTTTYNYNDIGKLVEEIDALGNKKSYEYDLNGNLKVAKDAKGNATTYYYDPLDRLQAVKDSMSNISQFTYNPSGQMEKAIDAYGKETKYEYNGKGMPVKVTDALGNVFEMKYDKNGNNTEVIDPEGGVRTSEYDAGNRVKSMTDAAGVKKTLQYDIMNRITKSEDSAGNAMTYVYDSLGKLKEQKDTIGRTVKFQYDAAGNIKSKTDIDGNITTYEYDLRGRVTKVTDPEGKV
jgi:YD repeat-containing protein